MKIFTTIDFWGTITSIKLVPEIISTPTNTGKSDTSIKSVVNPHTSDNNSPHLGGLKSFDTSVLAYHMMDLGKF